MIDITTEEVISLNEAAAGLPKRRAGCRPHVATLYRWTQRGVRGVLLETIQIGGTRCTSREALQRFFMKLTNQRPQAPQILSPTVVSRRQRAVERELDREGL